MIRLAVRAPADMAEIVLAELTELSPGGVEEVAGEGFVEYAVYGAPGELPSLPQGPAVIGGVAVSVSGTEVPDDWAERWKAFHRPVLIGRALYVRPPWEDATPEPGVEEVVIDPGRAFGTGSHHTTRMSLELLLDVEERGALADLGCGSGVIAIAAAKLGFAPVTAVDHDRDAVAVTRENAAENGVALARVEALDLRREPAPAADTIVANLMRPLLLRVAGLMSGRPRDLVASGLLEHEADEVAAAFAPLVERRRLTGGGWAALLLSGD